MLCYELSGVLNLSPSQLLHGSLHWDKPRVHDTSLNHRAFCEGREEMLSYLMAGGQGLTPREANPYPRSNERHDLHAGAAYREGEDLRQLLRWDRSLEQCLADRAKERR